MYFDDILRVEAEVGLGADAEVGERIPGIPNLQGYLGGYYFHHKRRSDDVIEPLNHIADMKGVSVRVAYAFNDHLKLEARDTYDNVRHNTFMLGITISTKLGLSLVDATVNLYTHLTSTCDFCLPFLL